MRHGLEAHDSQPVATHLEMEEAQFGAIHIPTPKKFLFGGECRGVGDLE